MPSRATCSASADRSGAWPFEASEGADVVIAAGGIGLPPLRGAILRMLARRERYGRLILLYGGRNPEELLYTDRARGVVERGFEVMVTVDSAGAEVDRPRRRRDSSDPPGPDRSAELWSRCRAARR